MDTTSTPSGSEQPQVWGFAAVPNWLVRDPSVSLHEKIVYLVLSSHIGDQGTWFMSHARIAQEAGVSVASVKRALGSLQERGVVSWSGRIDPATGAQLGNSYRIMTDRLGQAELPPSSQRATPPLSVSDQKKNPEEEPRTTSSDLRVQQAFDELWAMWPSARRDTKKTTWSALQSAMKSVGGVVNLDEILVPARSHAAAWARWPVSEIKYVPLLPTWLNKGRWTTEAPEARTAPGAPARPGVKANDEWMYR